VVWTLTERKVVSPMLAIGLWLVVTGCGGSSPSSPSPTAPSPPPTASAYEGTWSGYSVREQCTVGGTPIVGCGEIPFRGPLRAVLTRSGSSVQGTMALNQLQLAVSGQVAGDGPLALSGQG
jgi:hypothetical protein